MISLLSKVLGQWWGVWEREAICCGSHLDLGEAGSWGGGCAVKGGSGGWNVIGAVISAPAHRDGGQL